MSVSIRVLSVGTFLLLLCSACASHIPPSEAYGGAGHLNAFLAASEFLVGENRFPFAISDSDGRSPMAQKLDVRFYRLSGDNKAELVAKESATYRQISGVTPQVHEDGEMHMHEEVRGVYVVDNVRFHKPGIWSAVVSVPIGNGVADRQADVAFEVVLESATLEVGDLVPPSRNSTALDVNDLTEITTHFPPVPGLYELTILEALSLEAPFVVAFATPAYCSSRLCGPVTDMIARVYQRHRGVVGFIHIEPWDLELARREGRLAFNDISKEWQLPSEPWVFVVDSRGRVAARFEGFVTAEELESAIESVLPS